MQFVPWTWKMLLLALLVQGSLCKLGGINKYWSWGTPCKKQNIRRCKNSEQTNKMNWIKEWRSNQFGNNFISNISIYYSCMFLWWLLAYFLLHPSFYFTLFAVMIMLKNFCPFFLHVFNFRHFAFAFFSRVSFKHSNNWWRSSGIEMYCNFFITTIYYEK